MEHKKALYYNGHEQPDVVDYCQNSFLPAMAEHQCRLVEYVIGEVGKEVNKIPSNFVEHLLVLVAHDESTCQANDGPKSSWVLDGQPPLKKKGPGCGLHQSNCIASTVGWIKDVSQTLEYGKDYEGYWNGELFVKQVILHIKFLMINLLIWRSLIYSSKRNLFWHLRSCMAQGIKPLSWWTILRGTLLIQKMPYLSRIWILGQVVSSLFSEMDGITEMANKSLSPWYFHQIIPTEACKKVFSRFLPSRASGELVCAYSASSPAKLG